MFETAKEKAESDYQQSSNNVAKILAELKLLIHKCH